MRYAVGPALITVVAFIGLVLLPAVVVLAISEMVSVAFWIVEEALA